MDSWYAARSVRQAIEALPKSYSGPLKANRRVDDTDGQPTHRRVDSLSWSALEQQQSKRVHVKDFPKGHRLKLFRLVLSTQRTDYVVTNDLTQNAVDAVQEVCAIRWKIENFIGKVNNSWAGKRVSVVWPASNVIISPAPGWFGLD